MIIKMCILRNLSVKHFKFCQELLHNNLLQKLPQMEFNKISESNKKYFLKN